MIYGFLIPVPKPKITIKIRHRVSHLANYQNVWQTKTQLNFASAKSAKMFNQSIVQQKNKNNRFVFGIFIEIIQQYQCFYNDHQK